MGGAGEADPKPGSGKDRGAGRKPLGEEDPLEEAMFPEDYAYPVGPWHRRERDEPDEDPGTALESDNISDGAEWRSYADGVKGFERSSGGASIIYPAGLNPASYIARQGRPPIPRRSSRRKVITSRLSKNEYRLKKALDLMKDVISRIDVLRYNRELKGIASVVIQSYLEHMAKANKPIKSKDISVLVAAVLYKTAQILEISVSRYTIIEAVASSPRGEASVEYIDNKMWDITRKFNEIEDIRNIFLRERIRRGSRNRIHSVVRRSVNFVDTLVSRLDEIEETDKQGVSKIAKGILLHSYINGKSFDGKRAEALAAAAVYIASRLMDYELTQARIASVANVTEANVRKMFKFLVEGQVFVAPFKLIKAPLHDKPIRKIDI